MMKKWVDKSPVATSCCNGITPLMTTISIPLLSLYHEDAVLRLPGGPNIPFGGLYKGKAEIRQAHETAWETTNQEPIRVDEMEIHVSDEAVMLPPHKGVYLPNGELVRFPSLQIFAFAENLIIDHQVEFDTLDFVKRLQSPS